MIKKMLIFTMLSLGIAVAIVIIIVNTWSKPEKKEFDGYIIWLTESIVFSEDINIDGKGKFEILGSKVWVEQDDIVSDLYSKAYILDKNDPIYDFDDTRIIKVKFYGTYYSKGSYGHLGKYTSAVKIIRVVQYSSSFF